MKLLFKSVLLCLILLITTLSGDASAQNQFEDEKNLVLPELIISKLGAPTENVQETLLGIKFKIKEGWHIYWRNSGESGMSTRIKWSAPKGSQFGEIKWPAPEKFDERGDIQTIGYEGSPVLIQKASIPLSEEKTSITAELKWLVCKDICIPGSTSLTKDINQKENYRSESLLKNANKEIPPAFPISNIKHFFQKNKKSFSLYIITDYLSKNSIKEIENHVQVFPFKFKDFIASRPQAKTIIGESNLREAVIKVELTPTSGEILNSPEFSSVISISKELSKSGKDQSLIWSTSSSKQIKNRTSYEKMKWDNTKPLSYKLVSHRKENHKNENVEKKLSEKQKPKLKSQALKTEQNLPLLLAILYGFIGGIILNLMPCVLPIISIKVMSFIEGAEKSRKDAFASSFAFSSGILFSFFVLACIVTLLRSLGFELGWGFQFQHPEFVYGLIIIVFIIALGFFDVYTISMPFMAEANKRGSKITPGKLKDFFDGMLATALSTPCSAPFLGVALVVAFTQSTLATFSIFMAIGLGLALPYCYLATRPSLLAKLPKPGPWMYRLRQLMGFLLLGTILWLLFVLGNLKEGASLWAQASILVIFFVSWLREWKKESAGGILISIFFAAGFLFSAGIIYKSASFMHKDQIISDKHIKWLSYSPELVSQKLEERQAVFIDFTADWCVTCKANELYTISSQPVVESITKLNIASVKADWTSADPIVTEALQNYGAKGVPHYVILSPHRPGEAVTLSTLPSAADLIEAFEKANIP